MPELPDIILNQRFFNAHFLSKEITDIEIVAPKILSETSVHDFKAKLLGQKFKKSIQYGKYLYVPATGSHGLSIHFGMTGELEMEEELKEKNPPYTCALFTFKSGLRMIYKDRRRIGKLGLAKDLQELIKVHELGPDAQEVDAASFKKIFENKRGKIKPCLMDQTLVAGLGNVYTDEILFQSKIHPESSVSHLSDKHFHLIHKNITPVIQKAIQLNGERDQFPESKYLMSHREEGGQCPRDKTSLTVKTVGGRTTYFCEKCQEIL